MVRLFQCSPLASPSFTGVPTTPTASIGTNTSQIASTAFVIGQGSTSLPLMSGTAAVGSAMTFALADHVHPSDTSRAPSVSPTFTGTMTIGGPQVTTSTIIDKAYALASPAQNATVTIAATTHVQIITPPAAVLNVVTLGIQFPPPQDGLRFECAASAAITKLTCTATGTIQNAPTSISAGASFEYLYVASLTSWIRLR